MRAVATTKLAAGLVIVGATGVVIGAAAAPATLSVLPVSVVQPVAVQPTSAQSTQAAVQAMLDTVLGRGHAVVRVVADIGLGNGSVTSTRWGPTGPAFNQGSAVVTGPQATPVAVATQRANALGSTTTSVQTPPGALLRETVSVAVDTAALGRVTLGRLRPLIDSAAGVDVARGDVVTVVAVPFSTAAATASAAAAAAAATQHAADDRMRVIGAAATVAGGLLALGLVTALIARRRRRRPAAAAAAAPIAAVSAEPPALLAIEALPKRELERV